ncbi:MAG TPA: hypothetical protein VJ755_10245 [Gemmatimonadales bacterium]|nr:hypothetical protein [Gemmatimonadales bacterium]
MPRDPHRDQPIFVWGAPLGDPRLAYVAPVAAGRTWCPYSFLEPLGRNEPHLSSALRLVARAVEKAEGAALPTDRVVFERLGASVTKGIYPGMGHTVNADEIAVVRSMLDTILSNAPSPRHQGTPRGNHRVTHEGG